MLRYAVDDARKRDARLRESVMRSSWRVLWAGLLIAVPAPSFATWEAFADDSQLCAQSGLVVRAELAGQFRVPLAPDTPPRWIGVLVVGEVLKGDPRQAVVLLSLPSPVGPRLSTNIHLETGQAGLWFLHTPIPDSDLYVVDHPQRFIAAENVGERMDSIRQALDAERAEP